MEVLDVWKASREIHSGVYKKWCMIKPRDDFVTKKCCRAKFWNTNYSKLRYYSGKWKTASYSVSKMYLECLFSQLQKNLEKITKKKLSTYQYYELVFFFVFSKSAFPHLYLRPAISRCIFNQFSILFWKTKKIMFSPKPPPPKKKLSGGRGTMMKSLGTSS